MKNSETLDVGKNAGKQACDVMHRAAAFFENPQQRFEVALGVVASVCGAVAAYAEATEPEFKGADAIDIAIESLKLIKEQSAGA